MKIIYLSPSTIPSRSANSVHVCNMCQGFNDAGMEVELVCHSTIPTAQVKDQVKGNYGLGLEKTNIHSIRGLTGRGLNIQLALYSLFCLVFKGWMKKSDLIISRNLYTSFLVAWFFRIPHFYESHSIENKGFRKWVQRKVLQSHKVRIIAISDALAQDLKDHFSLGDKEIHILRDAARISRLLSEKSWNDQPQSLNSFRFRAGYFGQIYEGRGIDIIYDIAKLNTDTAFCVFGGDACLVEQSRKKYNLPNLFFFGHVTHQKARIIMSEMNVLLMPYQQKVFIDKKSAHDTSKWMSPMKMFEYMSSKVPIISSDLPVLREVLKHKSNSMLANPKDPQAWSQCLKEIREDEKLSRTLAKNAYDELITHYTWKARAEKLVKL